MASVTNRIQAIKKLDYAKQPRGGYINPKLLREENFEDGVVLSSENIHASLMGIVVDYLTRFCQGSSRAFSSPMSGAIMMKELEYGSELLSEVKGLDDNSIFNACRLCGYESVTRAGKKAYVPVITINPTDETIYNIKTMVTRSLHFFEKYGPVLKEDIIFEGRYTKIITTGDADFLTQNALWDMKVSKNKPTADHTLQLLIYYLMGKRSKLQTSFDQISKIGVFNPRLNTAYSLDVDSIDPIIIESVSKNVIGY